MNGWIPNIPPLDVQALYKKSNDVTTAAYSVAGQGLRKTYDVTVDAAQNPKVQKAAIIGGGAVVGLGVLTLGLPALGFTAAGVKAGSLAAGAQSMIGNVAAGSLFANMTSAGAAGTTVSTKVLSGITGGYVTSFFTKPKEDK